MKPSLGKLLVMMKNMVQISKERWVSYFLLSGTYTYISKRGQLRHLISNLIGFIPVFDNEMTHWVP